MQNQSPPLLLFPSGSRIVRLVLREKRFRVLVRNEAQEFWVHTNNSGSMVGLIREGRPAVISPAANPKRKLPWTLEAVDIGTEDAPAWVGVNTMTPNRLLQAAFHSGQLQQLVDLEGYATLQREVPCDDSRMDALLTGAPGSGLPPLWVEAKNVTMVEDDVAAFPDAVTERGRKHLETLMARAAQGQRTAVFCCIQRPDGHCFGPADYIDPKFAAAFWRAVEAGVSIWPVRAAVHPPNGDFAGGIRLGPLLPLAPPAPNGH